MTVGSTRGGTETAAGAAVDACTGDVGTAGPQHSSNAEGSSSSELLELELSDASDGERGSTEGRRFGCRTTFLLSPATGRITDEGEVVTVDRPLSGVVAVASTRRTPQVRSRDGGDA